MYLIFKSTRVQNRRRPFVSGTSWIIFNITYLILFSKTSAQNCLSVERRYGVLMCVEGDSRITPCLIAFHCASSSKPPKDDNHYVSLTLTMTRMSERNRGGQRKLPSQQSYLTRSPGGQSETSLPFIQTQTIRREQKEMEGVALGFFPLCCTIASPPHPPSRFEMQS